MSKELYLRKVVADVIPLTGTAKRFDGLRINFKIEKTSESAPNNAQVNIYNLSADSRALLEAKGSRLAVSIGYLGLNPNGIAGTGVASSSSVSLVLVGTIKKVTHELSAPDIITKIEVADGGNAYRNAKLEKGYPRNAKLETVINDLANQFGLPVSNKTGIPQKTYSSGFAVTGYVRDQLDMLAKTHGFSWSIQDETVQFTPLNQGTSENVVLLSPKSGLIGSPSKTDKGIEFQSLLQPSLRPGRRVSIESKFLNGTFVVKKVTHQGDSHEGDFLSRCEAVA